MTLMKKILLPILMLLCTVANAGDGARRVVIIGDSITDGNWGCIYNYKRTSAERSSTDMNHIYGHSYVLDLHPDVLSVLIGTNDIHEYLDTHKDAGYDVEAWKSLYRSLLQQVREQNPDVRLVLCTPFIAKQGGLAESPEYPLREQMTESLAAFDTMFRELIEKQPRPSFWIWDGIHPTPVGHRRMAKLWIRKVGRL